MSAAVIEAGICGLESIEILKEGGFEKSVTPVDSEDITVGIYHGNDNYQYKQRKRCHQQLCTAR